MRKGFTLIELLAVITILGIIAVISGPVILNVMQTSKENAFMDSAYSLISSARNYQLEQEALQKQTALTIVYTNGIPDKAVLETKGTLPTSGTFKIDADGKTELKLWSASAKVCIVKTKTTKNIVVNKSLTQANCKL